MSEYTPIPLPDYCEYPADEMLARAEAYRALMARRHSVREFSSRAVPRALIETAIRTAGTAPSGANHQPWHFAAISSAAIKAEIRRGAEDEERAFYQGKAGEEWLKALAPLGTDADKSFLEVAPWLIAIFGARSSMSAGKVMRKNYYVPESISIATGLMISCLHSAGLVTLTHTPSPMGFLNTICSRPANEKPYILLVTGYPAEGATIPHYATQKKDLSEIASFL